MYFQNEKGHHRKTGYLSNFRPGVYYSSKLDETDNTSMIKVLSDNYVSVNSKEFNTMRPGATGQERLPIKLAQKGTGFTRVKYKTTPPNALPMRTETENRDNYFGYQPDRMDLRIDVNNIRQI